MSWKTPWRSIQTGIAGLGAALASVVGSLDGLLCAFIAFTIADYITGVAAGITECRISSAIGFQGISPKSSSSP